MNRKMILILITAALIISMFFGCGADNGSTEPETTDTTSFTIPDLETLTFSEFKEMTSEQQMAIVESFESQDAYTTWFNEMLHEHEASGDEKNDPTDVANNDETTVTDEPTEVTQTTAANDPTDVTEPVEPTETTAPAETTEPSEPTENPDVTEPDAKEMTFLEYQNLSGEEQKEFINSFPSIDAFMAWHAAAVQEYKDNMTEWGSSGNTPTDPTIEIEG